ncbi:Serine/Threonine kinase domain protein (macronuclear) [Tetrahymena thermophila SB210]|uniref:Serine/Threonine kinase domain protein n=1 Tax=Tetrahymena thermophila (strain SB210) TaxID=312017 RepID=Q23TF3_TETTS|nr:Serine/Threonine kinase domain protein [Tetrahymena thermophila SB210]EAR99753.1 Serine/Threonine kinase domain protein [Tetrahymena thermophila SB210]|eukprot:XP_001019998.1 Serine/Threonine kinase domain protein [Tetrahymena thermophila SB210]
MFLQAQTIKTIGNRLEIIKQLGEGNFAKVYLAKDKTNDRLVAVKEIHQNNQAFQMISNEINALKVIKEVIEKIKQKKHGVLSSDEQEILQNSKHILEIEDPYIINENDYSYIIMKYYDNSIDFSQFLKTNDALSKISERDKLKYFYQLTSGLSLLHQQNICHRDLKLENILISLEQDQLIIIDFGHALLKKSDDDQMCGTKLFNSPQVVLYMSYNPYKNDVWQMGIILYYLLYQRFPFCEKNSGEEELQKAMHDFMHKKRDLPTKENTSQFVKDLLLSMLQRYEDCRPSMPDVNKKLKEYLFKDKPISNFKGPGQNDSRELRNEAKECTQIFDFDFQNLNKIKKIQVKAQKPKQISQSQSQYTIVDDNTNYNQEQIQQYDQFYKNQEVHSIDKSQNQLLNESQLNQSLSKLNINQSNQSINISQAHDFHSEVKIKRSKQQISNTEKLSGFQQDRQSIGQQKQFHSLFRHSDLTTTILSLSTALPSINQDINLNLIVNQLNENLIEIEQIINSSLQNYSETKQLMYIIKFYTSKLAHFLAQSLFEYAQYNQNKEWQCLYTTNFLVQWMVKTKQEEPLKKKIQDYIELSIKFKYNFQQSAKFIQTSNQSVSEQFQNYIKNIQFDQSNKINNFSTYSRNPFDDKFQNHNQDNFNMSNEQNYIDYYQLFIGILEYIQKQMDDNNTQFIQEHLRQQLQNIIQKVKVQITKISKIAHTKNLNESMSFLSSMRSQ